MRLWAQSARDGEFPNRATVPRGFFVFPPIPRKVSCRCEGWSAPLPASCLRSFGRYYGIFSLLGGRARSGCETNLVIGQSSLFAAQLRRRRLIQAQRLDATASSYA